MQRQKLPSGFWRYFGLLFGGMALAIAVFSYAFYLEEVKTERQHIMTRDLHHVENQQAILTDALASAFDTLTFIADQVRLHRPFSNPEGRRQLGADFISFLRTIPAYDQVRLLDMRGREFIRANRNQAGPRLVPADELQDKSGRYYFRESGQLAHGQIYLSALDLNMEHGKVERPFKPMIRLAAPAFEGERKIGIIVLNLRMANVLARIQQVNHMGESKGYLLNRDGFFLSSPHSERNWGFMLPNRHDQSFAARFPQAWQRISSRDHGQFEAGGDMFSFAAIDPLQALEKLMGFSMGDGISRHRWIIVSRLSAKAFARNMAHERQQFLSGTGLLMLAAALLAGILAWLHAQKAQARKLLDDSRRTLAHVMSSTPAVHYACRAEGNRFIPTFASPNLKTLLGFEPDAVIGDAEWWGSHLYPADSARIVEGFRAALSEGREKLAHEYRFVHADGGYRWVHDELTIVRDASSRPLEIVGSWLDITEHKQFEEDIRRKNAEFRKAQEIGHVGSFFVDIPSGKQKWSEQVFRMLGLAPRGIPATHEAFMEYVHPDDRGRLDRLSRKACADKKRLNAEYRIIRQGGDIRHIHTMADFECSEDGKPIAIYGYSQDITERKQAEEKIELALREKEALLREVHHRVKNNMQIISSLLKLQASHVEDVHLHEMYRDSQNRIRAMSMVHEQLYASAKQGTIQGQAYLENVVFSLVRSYGTSAQPIAVHVDAGEIFLNMDEAIPCGLIVNELVSNALKYAFADGKGEIKVSLTAPDDEHRLLRVYDNGCGLPPDLDTREPKTLGLQLVDTLAEQLGGELTISCEHGTDVRILFPAGEEENT